MVNDGEANANPGFAGLHHLYFYMGLSASSILDPDPAYGSNVIAEFFQILVVNSPFLVNELVLGSGKLDFCIILIISNDKVHDISYMIASSSNIKTT